MAAAHVPPPPEFEELDLLSQQTLTLPSQQTYSSHPSQKTFPLQKTLPSQKTFPSRQTYSSQQHKATTSYSKFGGVGGSSQLPYEQSVSGHSQSLPRAEGPWSGDGREAFVERVPETPCWRRGPQGPPPSSEGRLNFSFDAGGGREQIGLLSVSEVPEQFHDIFKNFTHFNYVQSKVFDDVMYTDNSLVTSAPTGSGKTVIFELAIVRLLMQSSGDMSTGKIIYVAPIKALCSERFEDWQAKFGPLGLRCCELTGDSQLDDYFELQNAQIVMTTPEKWDSMTRKWRDYKSLVGLVRLFLIDEVHQLNDESRGPTIEAIVSRMKTIQAAMGWEGQEGERGKAGGKLRFIAISATIPNISDIAQWLSTEHSPALEYNIDESHRPVRLRRVVLGYPDASTEFKFDLSLNYRLGSVIQVYSDQKPTLVFCATRKGTQQSANVLVKEARFVMNTAHKQRLLQVANSLRDSKLRDLVLFGVGYHHAGMDVADRKAIENMFTAGDLPVLFATSTLAMGVNLPAHLVVIKSTMHYIMGMFRECSESQILQMIGRAGRPQFDTTATAVIMTRNSTKAKYEALLSGNQLIESSLHHNLIEHLNAEVVLNTISDVSIALEWLRSTFFYVRVKKNPKHYGMPVEDKKMEEQLQQLCLKNLQMLESCSLVTMNDGFMLQPTELGRLMARYCVAFESMKRFLSFKGKETLADLVSSASQCKEFEDVRLRMNEKRVLNTLNRDKVKPTIRFQMPGKIKSTDMKVNCLLQATLGCLPIQEFGLNQDTQKIFRAASRLSKCLMEVQITGDSYQSLLSAVILHKCIQARLWEISKFVSKQLDKIGLTLSTTLVNAGLTSFEKLRGTSPRELELIMNRHPPFGNQIRDAVALLPEYRLTVNQALGGGTDSSEVEVTVLLMNHDVLKEHGTTWGNAHTCMLLVGDTDNSVLCKQRISDSRLLNGGQYSKKLAVQRARAGDELKVHYISLTRVGVDQEQVFVPKYSTASKHQSTRLANRSVNRSQSHSSDVASTGHARSEPGLNYKPCSHRCLNKAVCGHDCCKHGIPVKPHTPVKPLTSASRTPATVGSASTRTPGPVKEKTVCKTHRPADKMSNYVSQLHAKATNLPATPALNRIKPALSVHNSAGHTQGGGKGGSLGSLTDRFSYTPQPSMKYNPAQDSRTVPPAPESHDFFADDIWSDIDDASTAAGPSSKGVDFDLDEVNDYEDLRQEDIFSDEDTVIHIMEESYDSSHGLGNSPSKEFSSFGSRARDDDCMERGRRSTGTFESAKTSFGASKKNPFTAEREGVQKSLPVKRVRNSFPPERREGIDPTSAKGRDYARSMPLLFRGKKRIIDELLEVEGENSINTGNVETPESRVKRSAPSTLPSTDCHLFEGENSMNAGNIGPPSRNQSHVKISAPAAVPSTGYCHFTPHNVDHQSSHSHTPPMVRGALNTGKTQPSGPKPHPKPHPQSSALKQSPFFRPLPKPHPLAYNEAPPIATEGVSMCEPQTVLERSLTDFSGSSNKDGVALGGRAHAPADVTCAPPPPAHVTHVPAPPAHVTHLPAPPAHVTHVPAPPAHVTHVPAPPAHVTHLPAPPSAACSFFTVGVADAEDENEGDGYSSIFAGIF